MIFIPGSTGDACEYAQKGIVKLQLQKGLIELGKQRRRFGIDRPAEINRCAPGLVGRERLCLRACKRSEKKLALKDRPARPARVARHAQGRLKHGKEGPAGTRSAD